MNKINTNYELESRQHDYFSLEMDYDLEIPDEMFENIELTEIKEKTKEKNYLPF